VPTSLRDLIADTLEISPEQVTPELSTEDVDTWDSFRHLQLVLAIEGEYGVQFDPQQIPELTTVSRIQTTLEQKGVKVD
jgi:acyl carrier protein